MGAGSCGKGNRSSDLPVRATECQPTRNASLNSFQPATECQRLPPGCYRNCYRNAPAELFVQASLPPVERTRSQLAKGVRLSSSIILHNRDRATDHQLMSWVRSAITERVRRSDCG